MGRLFPLLGCKRFGMISLWSIPVALILLDTLHQWMTGYAAFLPSGRQAGQPPTLPTGGRFTPTQGQGLSFVVSG